MLWLYPIIRRFIARTPQKGAQTGIQLTLSTHAQKKAADIIKTINCQKAQDNSLAIWLWDESEKLIQFHSSNQRIVPSEIIATEMKYTKTL